MAWLLLSLRRLRGERVPALGLAALVLVTAFVFALAPRLLDRVADTSLRDEVRAAHPAVANIQLLRERRIEPGDTSGADPLGPIAETGKDLEADLPGSIEALLIDRG